jgi:hypothetical protein
MTITPPPVPTHNSGAHQRTAHVDTNEKSGEPAQASAWPRSLRCRIG